MPNWLKFTFATVMSTLLLTTIATAEYTDLMGFPELQALLGGNLPTGAGIPIAHVEAPDNGNYMPNIFDVDFSGKSISNVTGSSSGSSTHATIVAHNFYGNQYSIAPDIDQILVYEATHWLDDGMLKITDTTNPRTTTARIANHSYITNYTTSAYNTSTLLRTDFIVETDDFIQVIGLPNSFNDDYPIYKNAYNVISVGITAGTHKATTIDVDSTYTAGRVAPTIVTPGFTHNTEGQ